MLVPGHRLNCQHCTSVDARLWIGKWREALNMLAISGAVLQPWLPEHLQAVQQRSLSVLCCRLAAKPFHLAGAARCHHRSRSAAPITTCAHRGHQQQASHSAAPMERRAVLLGAAAAIAGAALPQAGALAAECEYQTAASGLQWCDVVEGTGEAPVAGARIRAHYTGRLPSGVVFDSSYERGRPLVFQVRLPAGQPRGSSLPAAPLASPPSNLIQSLPACNRPAMSCRSAWAKSSR